MKRGNLETDRDGDAIHPQVKKRDLEWILPSQLSKGINSADTFISDLWPPESGDNKLWLLLSHQVCGIWLWHLSKANALITYIILHNIDVWMLIYCAGLGVLNQQKFPDFEVLRLAHRNWTLGSCCGGQCSGHHGSPELAQGWGQISQEKYHLSWVWKNHWELT